MSTTEIEEPPGLTRRWTGRRVQRLEDPAMVSGATRYVSDVQLPGMLDAAFVRSTSAHARLLVLDLARVRAADGVRLVLTGDDLSEVAPIVDYAQLEGARKTPRPVLPADRVRFVGEPIAIAVATSRDAAHDAVALARVEYAPFDAGEPIHAGLDGDRYFRATAEVGDLDGLFATADHVVARRLRIPRIVTSSIETLAIVASYEPGSDELTCYVSTQSPHATRDGLAGALGLPASRVRVICPALGGSFGGKEVVLPEFIAVAKAAMALRRPVRWLEDRAEALGAGAHAKDTDAHLQAAFDASGELLAMRSTVVTDTGAYSSGIGAYTDFMVCAHSMPGLYRMRGYGYDASGVVSNKAPLSPFRGVGMTTAQTVRELVLDDAARAIGLDRMELRRRSMIDDGVWESPLGERYEAGSWRTAFERSLELIDYQGFLARQAQARRAGRLLGIGVSAFVEAGAIGSAGGAGGVPGVAYDSATVTLDATGGLTVAVPTFSHGQGHHTSIAQLAADLFGLAPEQVRVIDGDTARSPYGMGTFGSRSAVIASGAVIAAATTVRDRLTRIAAALLEADAAALEFVDGAVGIVGVPEARIPLSGLAGAAQYAPHLRALLDDPSLSATAFFDPPRPTHSNGSIAVTLEVDRETGVVAIDRIVAVEDCGRMLNPMIVDGQVRGGIAQGIGIALMERCLYDDAGRPLALTFNDYLIPRATDVARVAIEHLETPSAGNPAGVKGMGEGTASAAPAAIVCAVLDAISPAGETIDALPLTAQDIHAALAAASP